MDDEAGLAEAWECECGAAVLHWIQSIEIRSTLACASDGTQLSEVIQTVPPLDLLQPNQADVESYECSSFEHGRQTHSHHVAVVETLHGALATPHASREAAAAWLLAQGLDFEDWDPDGEDLHEGPAAP